MYVIVRFNLSNSSDFGFVYNSVKTDDESKQFYFLDVIEAEQARRELQAMNSDQTYQISKLDWL